MLVADHVWCCWRHGETSSRQVTKPLNPAMRLLLENTLRIPEELRGGVYESDGDGTKKCGTSLRIIMSHENPSIHTIGTCNPHSLPLRCQCRAPAVAESHSEKRVWEASGSLT